MLCLCCDVIHVSPESLGGLCVSCQWMIRNRQIGLDYNGDTIGLTLLRRRPDNPLGPDEDEFIAIPKNRVLTEFKSQSILDGMIDELIELAIWTRPQTMESRAWSVVGEIRSLGCDIEIDRQNAVPSLTRPRRLPYSLLLSYVELTPWIVDILSREDSARIAEEERLRALAGNARESHDRTI